MTFVKMSCWGFADWKGKRSDHIHSWRKTPGKVRLGAFMALKGCSLAHWMLSLMDSVTLFARDIFMLHWPWLYSLWFEDRWPDIWPEFSASMVLSLNYLATPSHHSASPWQEIVHEVTVTQSLPLFPLPTPHEQSCENHPLLALQTFTTQETDWQDTPWIHGALGWSKSYVNIDYCVYGRQGLEDTNANVPFVWATCHRGSVMGWLTGCYCGQTSNVTY